MTGGRRKDYGRELRSVCHETPRDLSRMKSIVECDRAATMIPNRESWLALHIACRKQAPLEVIKFLVENGPPAVKAVNMADWLPLHVACRNGAPPDVILYLAQQYPDSVKARNSQGKTPLDYAREYAVPRGLPQSILQTLESLAISGWAAPMELDPQSVSWSGPYSLYVFQSYPLVDNLDSATAENFKPIERLAFEKEAGILKRTLKDAVEIHFLPAIINEFSRAFSEGKCRVLHLSCHGHEEYLAIEDGFGGIYRFDTNKLEQYVKAGGGNLELVFIAACHSEAAAEAFLNAGARHVVCCRWDDKMQDTAAIEFALNFYRSLTNHATVERAFDLACETVRVLPQVYDSSREADKFLLLPKSPDDDQYHKVVIFPNQGPQRPLYTRQSSDSGLLPTPPKYFIGRERDMYKVLSALRCSNAIHLAGPPGIGKASLAAEVGRYVLNRKSSFLVDDVIWLPPLTGSNGGGDSLYESLASLYDSVVSSTSSEPANYHLWHRLTRELQGRQVLLLVDARDLHASTERSSRLLVFLGKLSQVARVQTILIGLAGTGYTPVEVPELDFASAASLFGNISQFVSEKRCRIDTPWSFARLLRFGTVSPATEEKNMLSTRQQLLFERIGGGIPAKIHETAVNMTAEEFDYLVRIARGPEFHIESRMALDQMIIKTSRKLDEDLLVGSVAQARELDKVLKELHSLLPKFPTLEDLVDKQRECRSLQLDSDIATSIRLRQEVDMLEIRIGKELNEKRREEDRAIEASTNAMFQGLMLRHGADQRVAVGPSRSIRSSTESPTGGISVVTFPLTNGCDLTIYVGSVLDFKREVSSAIVCWTNPRCTMDGNEESLKIADTGGTKLMEDIERLPSVNDHHFRGLSEPARCNVGNAVMPVSALPESSRRVIMTVGPSPRSPSFGETLRSCYQACMKAACEAKVEAVVFSSFAATQETLEVEQCEQILSIWLESVRKGISPGLSSVHYAASCPGEAEVLAIMARSLGQADGSIKS